MSTGADLVQLARPHIGEAYKNVLVPKNDRSWPGPWDCAEFASWLVFQATGQLFGCDNDDAKPAHADAYTGDWKRDAQSKGKMISVAEAAGTIGAFVLRFPPAPKTMGHIALSLGDGTTIEAKGVAYGVVHDVVSGRHWDTGVLVPGITYGSGNAAVTVAPPDLLYALGQPNMSKTKVVEIQDHLRKRGFPPGPSDGVFGINTAAAVSAFQESVGLVMDGEVGPRTAEALGLRLD